MSSASFIAAATTTANSPLKDASQYTAPLLEALPYLKTGLGFAFDSAKSAAQHLWLPMPLIMYIIAPFTVFFNYLGFFFIFAPYSTMLFLVEALHPLYVFCGVACLTGITLGWIGRTVAGLLVYSFHSPPMAEVVEKEEEGELEL